MVTEGQKTAFAVIAAGGWGFAFMMTVPASNLSYWVLGLLVVNVYKLARDRF